MSGSSKFARGGGRGLSRMVPLPLGRGMVPLRRGQPPGKEKGRPEDLALKGRGVPMKGNNPIGSGSAGGNAQREDFELVSCQEQKAVPLYAMAIRLTPGMLETLKREEELGGTTSMKFSLNKDGHTIKVAGEEFRFSSAPEPGHLCDIYEEQRRGEDGNGVLNEAGAVWRKLSVIRTLNATDKANVKARSVEAERLQKSRKAIILDHNNAPVNNKAATAGDANGRRAPVMIKGKKEPPQKKRKIVATAPVIPPLSAVKTRPMATIAEKPPVPFATSKAGKTSVTTPPEGPPVLSRPPSHGALVPPLKPKGAAAEEVVPSTKPTSVTQKDKVSSPALATGSETAAKTAGVVNMSELRNCLITLLVDNPKGMTIKAVEKAVGEAMPNARPEKKQIEKVIKMIASYHAPGKYMLKEGVEKGAFAKPSPGSGSSPETAPVDSPPLGDLPAPMENTSEQQESRVTHGSGENRSVALHQDTKRTDNASRNSSLPVRGGESAVSRAIRRAGEIVRDKSRTVVESAGHRTEDHSLKESTARQEMADADHVSIGGDESPGGSPLNENEVKLNGMEVENFDQDVQNPNSPLVLEVDNKKENSDGSDSSSSGSSSSDSGSDSDSESASGSRSGSGSDTDSDGSSSSGSEEENKEENKEENMDEDVDIISDDEDKADMDVVMSETPKHKPKARTSLERQESRVQKQASRGKKRRQKGSDVGMTPHGSEDVDIGEAGESGEIIKYLDQEATEKGAKGSNSEEEVDVVSSDEDTPFPTEQRIVSPAESGEHNDNAIDPELDIHPGFMEEVKGGLDNQHTAIPTRSGSESDHSIEEYETRAETSGVRGARAKAIGDQKDELDRKMEGMESYVSPRSRGSSGTKAEETPHSIERDSRTEVSSVAPMWKGSDVSGGPMMSNENLVSGGVTLRGDNTQRSLLGTPPMPKDGLDQGGPRAHRGPVKGKPMESKRILSKNTTGEAQGKGLKAQRGPQRFRPPGRAAKLAEAAVKSSGEGEMPMKASDGLSKISGEPGLIGKGPETREIYTAEQVVRTSQDWDVLERSDVHRRSNREAGILVKPGKASELNRDKDSNLLGKPGRDSKQSKKPVEKLDGLRRGELPDRAGTGPESGEKVTKDTEIQRRLPRDGESWRKSPRMESVSRVNSDNEVLSARLKDLQKSDTDQSEVAKNKVARMTSDLELGELSGELRDIVAEPDSRAKDSVRHVPLKLRENSELPSRQPQNKVHVSPEKEKVRNTGKLGDIKRRSPADVKKQKLAKKELQKAEVPLSLRETVRPASSGQKLGVGHEERLEMVINRAVEATKALGDHNEKHIEGRNGKRLAEDGGSLDLGRPLKRTAFEQSQAANAFEPSQAATSLGRGEPDAAFHKAEKVSSVLDTTSKFSAVDIDKGILGDGGIQPAANSSKAMGDNGRVLGPKSKGQEGSDKEVVDKRGSVQDGKQKTTAGLLGPGSKKDIQSNGKKRSAEPGDVQSREFFAPYEKRTSDLKGPILQHDQYLEYSKEYQEKYPIYIRLNTVLESDKEDFDGYSRDIVQAKAVEDKNKLGIIYGKVRKDYIRCAKRFKRMRRTFNILHEELKVIKQRCKDYAEKVAKG